MNSILSSVIEREVSFGLTWEIVSLKNPTRQFVHLQLTLTSSRLFATLLHRKIQTVRERELEICNVCCGRAEKDELGSHDEAEFKAIDWHKTTMHQLLHVIILRKTISAEFQKFGSSSAVSLPYLPTFSELPSLSNTYRIFQDFLNLSPRFIE